MFLKMVENGSEAALFVRAAGAALHIPQQECSQSPKAEQLIFFQLIAGGLKLAKNIQRTRTCGMQTKYQWDAVAMHIV